jgi:LmbE family N-acetylglucosaminyl deacetylase
VADSEGIERILVVAAHPDDVDFGAAATVAHWVDEGHEVTYCIVTDGDAGGHDPTVPRSEIASIRRAEQTAAAKEVGVSELVWLGYPDGQVMVSLALRRDLARVIRQVRPRRVVCPWPARSWDRIFASHPDHMAVGEASMCAVYPDSRNPFAFPELAAEGFDAHIVDEVWAMGTPANDTYVDVTDTFDRKVAALRRHVSQTGHIEDLASFLRGWLAANAAAGGLPEGRLAEGFRRIDTSEFRRPSPLDAASAGDPD